MAWGRDMAAVVVVGSGPNGLAAGIEMARAGFSVTVWEGAATIGGGCRSVELTQPGFVHDVCSAVHPLGAGSPFFGTLPLEDYGLTWIHPPVPLAHPLDDGSAGVLARSISDTSHGLGPDARAYERLMAPLAESWPRLREDILAPPHFPRHPWLLARFGRSAFRSARSLVNDHFEGPRARALMAGLAAHSFLRLDQSPSAAFALVLGILGHAMGWPIPRGGSQRIADALAGYLGSRGGRVVTGHRVESLDEWAGAEFVFLDVTPRQVLKLAGPRLSWWYRAMLRRYRYGPGVFKIDWALAGPIPWRAEACTRAGTVHVGGTFEEIAAAEYKVHRGQLPESPFVLVAQPSLFDPARAPAGKHTGWAYCHVPHGSPADMTEAVERQMERFAPGFRERVLARHIRRASEFEDYNPNCIGGDINGGLADLRQFFLRPVPQWNPYATGIRGVYLCSSSTPPGGGVHGMCGYHAARAALEKRGRQ